ncbi:MAG: hypothetical protein U7127_11010 [Phormidium sp.]
MPTAGYANALLGKYAIGFSSAIALGKNMRSIFPSVASIKQVFI